MAQFIQMICPNCGGDLVKVDGDMYRCENCHVYHKIDNRNLHHDLLDVAAIRESLNFKLAEQKCRKLLQEYASSDLTDVYWNLLLCEQRVLFETDQKGAQFPSFYDIVPTDIESSENYKKCNECLKRFDSQNAYNYEELVDKMVSAKRKYRRIKESSKPFDIFICFKKSKTESEGGGETRDYKIAYQLYNVFCKSYNVFFSEESLFNIGGVTEYEPHIYHALYTAKIMFLICSKREYLESQWVKNEWSRFKRMADNAQQTKVIIPIFVDDFTPEYLPDDIKSCQGLNNDMYLIDRLKTSVNNFLHPVDKEAELNAKIEAEVQRRLKSVTSQPVSKPTAQQVTAKSKSTNTIASKPVTQKYIVPYGTKKIENSKFEDREDIKTAIIPDTVTSIGEFAFAGCTGLTSIIIPDSVTSIGGDAFNECSKLVNITIGKGVTSIGNGAFDNTVWYDNQPDGVVYAGKVLYTYKGTMPNNTSIIVKDGTVYITDYAFSDCTGLTNITIPNSVTYIGYSAFSGCSKLTSITIPDSVGSIGASAFDGCNELTNITFGKGIKSFGDSAFRNLSGLTSITIPDSTTVIGNFAFGDCTGVKSVTISDSVESIGVSSFRGCTSLTDITIGENVTSINIFAFDGCKKLNNITYKGTKKQWTELTKGYGWNDSTGKYVVHCTDGDLKKSIFNKNI